MRGEAANPDSDSVDDTDPGDPGEGVDLVGPGCLGGHLGSSLMGGGFRNPFDPEG